MSRRSFLLGSMVLLAWITTMLMIYKDRTAQVALDTGSFSDGDFFSSVTPAEKWQDLEDYMLVIQADKPNGAGRIVGAAETTLRLNERPTSTSTYRAEFHLEAKLSALLPVVIVKGTAQIDKSAHLTSFFAAADISRLKLTGQGVVDADTLYIKTFNGNENKYLRKSLTGPVSLGEVLQPVIGRRLNIRAGEKMSTPVVDPLTGRNLGIMTLQVKDQESITLDGKPTPAFRVTSDLAGVQTEMWVDQDGNTLRRNLINGLRMDRTTKQKAYEVARSLAEPVKPPALDVSEFPAVSGDADDAAPPPESPMGSLLGVIFR